MKNNHFSASILAILILSLALVMVGCGPSGSGTAPETTAGDTTDTDDADDTPDPVVLATPSILSLSLSQTTVKSDNSDKTTISATVLDADRAIIPGITVTFSADAGQLDESSAVADEEGRGSVSFSSGTDDPSVRTANVTATVTGLDPVTIPVQIVGSSLTMSTDNTTITNDSTSTASLTVTAKNAGGTKLFDETIVMTVSGTGSVDLTVVDDDGNPLTLNSTCRDNTDIPANTGCTDVGGELRITVTGTQAGSVTVKGTALGTSVEQNYTVSPVGATFGIDVPAMDPYRLDTGEELTIRASAPAETNVTRVQFATTLGTLTGGGQTGRVVTVDVAEEEASATLTSSLAGVATVQVFDAEADDPPAADTLTVAISAPTREASQIALQASTAAVAPSTGDVKNTVSLIVTVKNISNQVVGSAPVAFSIVNPTGGGESISPVIVYTDDQGTATSIFTSGSLSSDARGVTVRAEVVGSDPVVGDDLSLVIGGTAGSVAVGQGSAVATIGNDTAYRLPMSVLVADSNGNPVSGAVVSLNAWPSGYATGSWKEIKDGVCIPTLNRLEWPNEDTNRNLILDTVEDKNADGQLNPPNSAAGSLPSTVTTDENGVAQFDLFYTKSSAGWIKDEITATVVVSGTETRSTYPFWLPWLKAESCSLADSPYNQVGQSISVASTASRLVANGQSQSTIVAAVTDSLGNPVPDGTDVTFTTTGGDIDDPDDRESGAQTTVVTQTRNGIARAELTSPTVLGTATVTATFEAISSTTSVEFTPGPPFTVHLTAAPTQIPADGRSKSTISARVTDGKGNLVADGETITFTTGGSGTLSSQTAATENGIATIDYTASFTLETATITATAANEPSDSVEVTTIDVLVRTMTLTLGAPSIVADGESYVLVRADVRDADGYDIVDGKSVVFTTTAGDFEADEGYENPHDTTTINGVATAKLRGTTTVGTATVTVTADGVSQDATVSFVPGPVASITISATPSTLTADGASTSSIEILVTDAFGNTVADHQTITFELTGAGTLSSQIATTFSGEASVTYTAPTTTGTATISAEATNGTEPLTPASITLVPATVGSVNVTVGSNTVVADGASLTSVTVTVRDKFGNLVVDGTEVNLSTSAGTLTSDKPTTTNGLATTTLKSPTLIGSATIRATVGGVSDSASVTFIPDVPDSVILTASPDNLTADGSSRSTIRATVTDANGNIVKNGETITFTLTGVGTLSDQTAKTSDGVAIVYYTAPSATGDVSISAKATNEKPDDPNAVSITLIDAEVGTVVISAGAASVVADGTSGTSISVTVKDPDGNAVADGTEVSLTATAGRFGDLSPATSGGVATTTLASPTKTSVATVTAAVGGVIGSTTVAFIPGPVSNLVLSATTDRLIGDGSSTTAVNALVTDANDNNVADGETITFTVTTGTGTLSAGTATTANGLATVDYTASSSVGTETVKATAANGTFDSVAITLVSIGSVELRASPTNIPADGKSSTSITATIRDSSGSAVPLGTSLVFTTTLGTFPGGVTTYPTATADTSGGILVSLISGVTAGTAVVTATSGSVTQATNVEFTVSGGGTPGDPASIEVSSVQRDPVSIKGSGQPESSTITFVVKDQTGLLVADDWFVDFSITGGGIGGGELLSTSSDQTVGGYVSTTLQSGTNAGTVQIYAVLRSFQSVTTNIGVTIVGGLPYGEHLGLDPTVLNIAGLVRHGLEDTMTTRVTDKFFNNVPDGTSVYFTSDYGGITGSAVTASEAGASSSFATATLTSQVPDPPTGFVTPATFTQSGSYARVLSIAIDQTDNDIIYIGTDGGGIYKTIDGGTNWTQPGVPEAGLTNGIVWDIKVDPGNRAILYATTDNGIFRSTGSGDQWENIGSAKTITGETPTPNPPGTLDITDADSDGYSDQLYTLAYASNTLRSRTHVYLAGVETLQYDYIGSQTIRFIVKDLTLQNGQAVTIDYETPQMVPSGYPIMALALGPSGGGSPVTDRTIYAGIYGKGIYKSTDGGFSWSAANSGLANQDVLSLGIPDSTSTTLYAGTDGGGVFKTTDSAGTWTAKNSGLLASVITAITVDPKTTANIYLGTEQDGVFHSTDGADTWNLPTTNVTSLEVTDIALDGTTLVDTTDIYAATYGDGSDPVGGVYKSADSGVTWTRTANTSLADYHVHALGIIPGAADTLFACTWGRNFLKSTDAGDTWSLLNGSAPDELTNQIYATSSVLFSGLTQWIRVVQVETSNQGAGGDDYLNAGAQRSVIYSKGTATFLFSVQDSNGNPLVGGTTIDVSANAGSLSGDTSITLADRRTNRDYSVTWTNNITGDANLVGTLFFNVASDNGNETRTVTRTLIKPVAVTLTPAAPGAATQVTVVPAGGSETEETVPAAGGSGYTIVHPQGTAYTEVGGSVTYTSGGIDDFETVTVTDDVTGESASASYTIE